MKIRMHRGGYAESRETEEEIPATMANVMNYLSRHGWPEAHVNGVTTKLYSDQPNRGWAQHYMVIVNGIGPAAFSDAEVYL